MLEEINDFAIHSLADEPISDGTKVHIWLTDLDRQDIETPRVLEFSQSEQVRATGLKNPLDQRRYIASRVFTRSVLSNMTGIPPDSLEFCRDKCGKPWLRLSEDGAKVPSQELGFNLSHSENILGIAAGVGFDVGLDIEVVIPGLDVLAIAQVTLEQAAVEQLQSSPVGERPTVFYRLWTRREAFAKMQGHGVASDHVSGTPTQTMWLRSFEFILGDRAIVGSVSLRPITWSPPIALSRTPLGFEVRRR